MYHTFLTTHISLSPPLIKRAIQSVYLHKWITFTTVHNCFTSFSFRTVLLLVRCKTWKCTQYIVPDMIKHLCSSKYLPATSIQTTWKLSENGTWRASWTRAQRKQTQRLDRWPNQDHLERTTPCIRGLVRNGLYRHTLYNYLVPMWTSYISHVVQKPWSLDSVKHNGIHT